MTRKDKRTWITENEAASIIGLPANFFRKVVTNGSLKGVIQYISSRRYSYRYHKTDFENYLFEDSHFSGLFPETAF